MGGWRGDRDVEMRSRLWLMVAMVLGVAGVACSGGGGGAATQSESDWAAGYCAVFDRYYSATQEQVSGLELKDGTIDSRLADGLSLAEGQVALLSEAAAALDELAPPRAEVGTFEVEVSAALRVDAERMQRFVDEPPSTVDELNQLLDVGSTLGDSAIEVMRTSTHLSDGEFFTLVDQPACAKWS